MRQAKNHFDDLVRKIQDGENVTFGQMERVYAEGFLGKFLEKVASDTSKEKMQKFYRDNLVDPDEAEDYFERHGEDMELSRTQLSKYSLELISMMSGVLGVRASTAQLSPFIEKALRDQDWELLDKTLALSDEGTMGTGVIEKVALEQLVSGNFRSYEDLKGRFPNIKFNQDKVNEAYKDLVGKVHFEAIERVRSETGYAVPQEYVQEQCENLLEGSVKNKGISAHQRLDQSKLEALKMLKKSSGRDFNKTARLKEALVGYFGRHISESHQLDEHDSLSGVLRNYEELFGVLEDEELSTEFQGRALDLNQVELFKALYQRSQHKLSEESIRGHYDIRAGSDLDQVCDIASHTGVSPDPELSKRAFTHLLLHERYEDIGRLSESTGQEPTYNQDNVDGIVRETARALGSRFELSRFRNLVERAHNAGNSIEPFYVHEAAREYILASPDWSSDFNETLVSVDGLYSLLGIQPSEEVTATKVQGLVTDLHKNVERSIKDYSKTPGGRY